MEPELRLGERFDFKVDIDPLAMLKFVVLIGLDPFPDCKQPMIHGERPTIPDSVNRVYTRLIAECWEATLDNRPGFPRLPIG